MKLVKKLFFIFLITLIAVLIAYFARVNDTNVTLNLIFVSVRNIQLWLLSLFCFLAGVIFSVIIVFVDFIVMAGKERKLNKEVKKLKSELIAIRNEKLADIDDSTFAENSANLPVKDSVDKDQEQN
ncbi:LapA family protein [bacterium]|nr:LapA family protein [bacterium]